MLPQFTLEEGEIVKIQLVEPADYASHANQVAAITDRRFLFIKRKEFSKHPYALEVLPLGAWSSVKYRSSFALASMLAGLIMVVFGFLIFYFRYTGDLEGGPSLGFALVMLASGVALVFGVRRHKLLFRVGDRTLRWRSAALSYRETLPTVHQVVNLASEKGIPTDGA